MSDAHPPAPDPAPVLKAAEAAGVTLHPDAVQFLSLVQFNPQMDTQSAEQNRADPSPTRCRWRPVAQSCPR